MDDNLLKNFMNELGEDYDSKSYEKYKELEDLLFMKNGKALIYSSRIKYELMSLRRHSLDFGYEELNIKEIPAEFDNKSFGGRTL